MIFRAEACYFQARVQLTWSGGGGPGAADIRYLAPFAFCASNLKLCVSLSRIILGWIIMMLSLAMVAWPATLRLAFTKANLPTNVERSHTHNPCLLQTLRLLFQLEYLLLLLLLLVSGTVSQRSSQALNFQTFRPCYLRKRQDLWASWRTAPGPLQILALAPAAAAISSLACLP
jgi:hypothetical protein